MHRVDYGIATRAWAFDGDDAGLVGHASLTEGLGCLETEIDMYRTAEGGVSLGADRERLCIPIGGGGDRGGAVTVTERHTVPAPGLAFVPDGRPCTIESTATADWIVINTPGDPGADRDPVVVDAADRSFTTPSTSDVLTARLTADLEATGMKVNLRRLEPDEAVPYHVEGRQEEVFVPISGPGTMRVAGRAHDVPRGSVTRVAPATPRSAVNTTEEPVIWAMAGAPPTGAVDGWDPGATLLEWPDGTPTE